MATELSLISEELVWRGTMTASITALNYAATVGTLGRDEALASNVVATVHEEACAVHGLGFRERPFYMVD
jgi:hypothetical protein